MTVALMFVRVSVRGCSCRHIHCGNSRGGVNARMRAISLSMTVYVREVNMREVKLRDCDMG